MSATARSRFGLAVSGDMNHGVLNSAANSSGPSLGASSLVTDANSSLSGGPQLQRSSSINNESYMHLPASPMSSSNNISCSSAMDGSSIVQHSPLQEQMTKQGASSANSQTMNYDTGNFPVHKRPRLDMRQGDANQQQFLQQMLQRSSNPQLQTIINQQRAAELQQQQILQSLPQLHRMQLHQQNTMSRTNPLQVVSPVRPPSESGLCARRLMQYLYHQSHRHADNSITYWRKFVTEYFAPRARKRWCLSLYNSSGTHALGAFPQAAMDAWQCSICGSKTGKGFEATYEVLPRLNQIKFDHGVIDELLYLDMPREGRLPSGMMVLDYAKAVQESVHEQLRVVREGKLRIIFTPDLKVMRVLFCLILQYIKLGILCLAPRRTYPRRLIAHQVNQLLQVAQKYQAAVNVSGSSGVSIQDLQTSCNMFVATGRQMARSLELQSLNDLGFSKRYVRCLQISEVVSSMKDLIDFGRAHNMGPIESLKHYSQQAVTKFQTQKAKEGEQKDATQNLLSDQNAQNKFMAMNPGVGPKCFLNSTSQGTGPPFNNYQHLLRNSPIPGLSPMRSNASFTGFNQAHPVSFNGTGSAIVAGQTLHDISTKNQQQQALQGVMPPTNTNEPTTSQAKQNLQQQMIHQIMQDVINNGPAKLSTTTPSIKSETTDVGKSAVEPKTTGQQMRSASGISTCEISGDIKKG
ncbi:hypothetical protein HPP92_003271 [Vanilla planifolia]|uniref:Transcriptional regulator SLK2 n=1 Tax=Vanilla planifolia TaxID=51239 RepID=A0A835VIS7_VANPL|nr:hypothetical protein HPP92_003271 [Vanilla planifolia]